MDTLHTLLYLTANAFHIYVFSRAMRAVLGRPRMAVVEKTWVFRDVCAQQRGVSAAE